MYKCFVVTLTLIFLHTCINGNMYSDFMRVVILYKPQYLFLHMY